MRLVPDYHSCISGRGLCQTLFLQGKRCSSGGPTAGFPSVTDHARMLPQSARQSADKAGPLQGSIFKGRIIQ